MSTAIPLFARDDDAGVESLELRPLQTATLQKVREAWMAGAKNVLVQAPCGFGKTELATGMLQAVHEKGRRGSFLCDRVQLVHQTSQRFDKYGLPHGIIQADNPRYRPDELIQVCSVDTLASRGHRVHPDLLFVDECHIMRKTTKALLKDRNCRAVGLTATPTTRGLGKYFDAMVTAATTNQLIREGLLVPFRVYAPSEPDMEGVKVTKMGEWDEHETERRVLEVVGDCVAEYMKRGEGRKFIGFARTKVHAAALQRSFAEAGIVTALYTDDQGDEERRLTVGEFRKSDSYIRGLWSVEALTRGFDVADVSLGILARPLRNGFHVHIQMLGRILRIAEGKSDAIVLDHAGNTVRFWSEQCEYMETGWPALDDGRQKEKKKAEKKERQPVKCGKCSHVHAPAPACPSCGFIYPRRNDTHHVPGELSEFGSNTPTATRDELQTLYSQLLWVGDQYGHKEGAAAYRFKEKTGRWPDGLGKARQPAPHELERWVLSRVIAYAKGAQKRGRKA